MAGEGRELNAQLFIEGRHVPFNSATCNFQAGQPSSATINMVPLREINNVLPRTMVHLFVRDQSFPGKVKPWVLMFEGEVYGYGGNKSMSNRSVSLLCMDYSNYWDNAKQYYMNLKTAFGDSLSVLNSQKAATEARRDQMDVKTQESSVQAYLTRIVDNALKANKDFLTAITEIVENIKEVNSFFRYADARYRINDRIVFKSSGNIKELFDFQNKNNLMDQLTGRGNGGVMTVRQIVNSLMALIFHDFVSVPAPSKVTKDSLVKSKKGIGKANGQTIGSFIFKPNTFILPPPKCNIIFPDFHSDYNFSRNFFHEVTRFKLQPNLPGMQIGNTAEAQVFQSTVYAPSGFNKYQTGADVDETKDQNQQFEGPEQGTKGDESKGVTKTSNTLQDFNFLSYEEILKGIFPDLGNTIPSAQIFTKSAKFKDNQQYYKRAADFLFHKKRLASRSFSTSGPLNLAPVPGFPMLLLDDSDGEQHITGTLMRVTHRVSADSGGYTSYDIGFSRYVEEQDLWDGSVYEPPIPPWYDPAIFGARRPVKPTDYSKLPKSQQDRVRDLGSINDYGNTTLADYYSGLLGDTRRHFHLGSAPLTSKSHPTLVGATLDMLNQYRAAKKSDKLAQFISVQTRRDYVGIEEHYEFLGANNTRFKKKGKTSPTLYQDLSGLVFKGGTFDGGFVNNVEDEENNRDAFLKTIFGTEATKKRRAPIDAYRKRLTQNRGFRG